MKIKKGDTVLVTRGKDKGKKGNVKSVSQTKAQVLVEGVNQYKKHIKRSASGKPSEIMVITKPLTVSAVALICSKCKKQTRVGYKIGKAMPAGRQDMKVRICKKCGKEI